MNELKALILAKPSLTLAVAESLTCGRVQAMVGSVSGASTFFLGGITAYTLAEKVRHLGVDRAEAEAVNCVSSRVAEQMASGACRLFGSDLGVSTTGYAEPDPGLGIKTPFAWWGLARRMPGGAFSVSSGRVDCPGLSRTDVQERVASEALAALRTLLRERSVARMP